MWYPTEPAYNGAMGAPINMSGPQGGANADNTPFPPNAFQRDHNVSAPSLFAVRGRGKAGRVALLNKWRQFTVGSGSRWLYNDVVLSRGLRGRRSTITSPRGGIVMTSLVLSDSRIAQSSLCSARADPLPSAETWSKANSPWQLENKRFSVA